MNELEAMELRHSVRNFEDKKIDTDTIKKLQDKLDSLNAEGNLRLTLLEDAGNTFNRLLSKAMGLASAPSVIACIGKDSEDLDERIGYYGQSFVLYAQTLGLNTCWAGTFNKKKMDVEVDEDERLVIVIAIGYGKTQGKQHKSKSAKEVSNVTEDSPVWFKNGVEAALLAPTAINQQKFSITLLDNNKVEIKDLGGIFSKVDLGIVKYQFELGMKK